jgi:hypothetical protein
MRRGDREVRKVFVGRRILHEMQTRGRPTRASGMPRVARARPRSPRLRRTRHRSRTAKLVKRSRRRTRRKVDGRVLAGGAPAEQVPQERACALVVPEGKGPQQDERCATVAGFGVALGLARRTTPKACPAHRAHEPSDRRASRSRASARVPGRTGRPPAIRAICSRGMSSARATAVTVDVWTRRAISSRVDASCCMPVIGRRFSFDVPISL